MAAEAALYDCLYGDLDQPLEDVVGLKNEIRLLQARQATLTGEVRASQAARTHLKRAHDAAVADLGQALESERQWLSSLLLTAKTEINRKNQRITELVSALDRLMLQKSERAGFLPAMRTLLAEYHRELIPQRDFVTLTVPERPPGLPAIDLYDIKTVKRGNFNTVIMGHQAMIHHIYGPQPSPAAQTPARTLRIKRKARPPLPAGEAQPESPLVQPPPRKKRKPSNSSENQSQGPATSDPGSQDPIRMTGTSSEGSIKPPKSDPSHASESKSANNLQPPLKTVLHRDNSRVPQGPNAGQVESDSSTRDVRQASPTSVPSHQASKASLNRSKDLPAGHSSEQSRITTSKELPGPDEGNATRKSEKLPMDVLEGLSEESRQGREARRPGATNDFTERSSLKRGAPYAQVTKDQGSKPTKSSRDSSSRSQKEREEDEAATKQGNVDASQKSTRSSEVGKHQATRIPSSSSRGYSSKDNPRKEIVLRSVVVKPESNMVSSFETPPLSLIERVGSTKGAMDSPPVDNHDIKAPSNHSKSSSLSVASLHSQRSEKKKATFDLSEQQLAASSDFSELLDKVVGGASKCDRSAKMDQEPTKILKAELKRAKLSQDGSGNLAPNSGSGVSSRELAGRKPSGKEWEDSAEPSKVGKGGQLGVESTKIRANFKNIADESNRSSPTITSFSESSTENSKPVAHMPSKISTHSSDRSSTSPERSKRSLERSRNPKEGSTRPVDMRKAVSDKDSVRGSKIYSRRSERSSRSSKDSNESCRRILEKSKKSLERPGEFSDNAKVSNETSNASSRRSNKPSERFKESSESSKDSHRSSYRSSKSLERFKQSSESSKDSCKTAKRSSERNNIILERFKESSDSSKDSCTKPAKRSSERSQSSMRLQDSLDGQKRTTRGSSQHSGGTGFLEMENRFPKDEKKLETRSYRTKLDAAKSFPKHTSKPSNASPDPSSRLPPISESGKPSPRTGSERSSQAEGDTRTGLLPHSNSDTNHQSSSPTETKTKANVAKDSIQDERSKRFESREKRLKLVSAKQSDAQTKDSSDGCKPKVPATEVDTVPNELANVEEGEIESESENEPIILRLKTSLKSSDVKQPKALCRELFGSDTESQDTFNPLHIEMDAEDRRGRSSPITKADVTDMNSTEIETLLEEKKTQYESLSKKADRYLRLLTSNSETNSPARETPASPEVDSPRPASEGDAPFEVDPSTFKPATPAAYAFSPLQNVPTYGSNRKTRIQRGRFDFTSPGGIASLLREVTDGAHLGHGNVIMTPQSGRSRSSSISSTAGGVSSAPTTGTYPASASSPKDCFPKETNASSPKDCFPKETNASSPKDCFPKETNASSPKDYFPKETNASSPKDCFPKETNASSPKDSLTMDRIHSSTKDRFPMDTNASSPKDMLWKDRNASYSNSPSPMESRSVASSKRPSPMETNASSPRDVVLVDRHPSSSKDPLTMETNAFIPKDLLPMDTNATEAPLTSAEGSTEPLIKVKNISTPPEPVSITAIAEGQKEPLVMCANAEGSQEAPSRGTNASRPQEPLLTSAIAEDPNKPLALDTIADGSKQPIRSLLSDVAPKAHSPTTVRESPANLEPPLVSREQGELPPQSSPPERISPKEPVPAPRSDSPASNSEEEPPPVPRTSSPAMAEILSEAANMDHDDVLSNSREPSQSPQLETPGPGELLNTDLHLSDTSHEMHSGNSGDLIASPAGISALVELSSPCLANQTRVLPSDSSASNTPEKENQSQSADKREKVKKSKKEKKEKKKSKKEKKEKKKKRKARPRMGGFQMNTTFIHVVSTTSPRDAEASGPSN